MAHLALFRNSLLLLFLCACSSEHTKTKYVKSNLAKTAGGITRVNEQPFTGVLFELYQNGDTAFVQSYKNGLEHGEWNQFYPNHIIKEKRNFSNGKKTGEYFAYWPNGKQQMNYIFDNDEYNGTCREWFENGALLKEMNYNMGHEEGSQKVWYENGKIKSNYTVMNGRRFGLLGTKNCRNVSDSIFNDQ